MPDTHDVANVFEDPKVSEMWLTVTDLTGDPTIAKDVIRYLSVALWNLPWATWMALHEAAGE